MQPAARRCTATMQSERARARILFVRLTSLTRARKPRLLHSKKRQTACIRTRPNSSARAGPSAGRLWQDGGLSPKWRRHENATLPSPLSFLSRKKGIYFLLLPSSRLVLVSAARLFILSFHRSCSVSFFRNEFFLLPSPRRLD